VTPRIVNRITASFQIKCNDTASRKVAVHFRKSSYKENTPYRFLIPKQARWSVGTEESCMKRSSQSLASPQVWWYSLLQLTLQTFLKYNIFKETNKCNLYRKIQQDATIYQTWRVVGRVVCGRVRHSAWHVYQLHVQQPSTYEKPEAANAVLGSWWWAVCRLKHVELHIIWNYKILIHCCILFDFSLWILLWYTEPRTSSQQTHLDLWR